MRNLIDRWRAQTAATTLTDYRRSMVLDAVAAIAIITYIVASHFGPPPTWAKMVYLVGIVSCGAAATSRRSWFSLACLAVLTMGAVEQVVTGAWVAR